LRPLVPRNSLHAVNSDLADFRSVRRWPILRQDGNPYHRVAWLENLDPSLPDIADRRAS
jgi:hypothetical protein